MTKVVVVLLDVVHKALFGQSPFAELHDERVTHVRAPEWQVGLNQVGSERVRVVRRRPDCQKLRVLDDAVRPTHGGIDRARVRCEWLSGP